MLQTLIVLGTDAADDAVDLVAFAEQQLGQVATILASDARDECRLLHVRDPSRQKSAPPSWRRSVCRSL